MVRTIVGVAVACGLTLAVVTAEPEAGLEPPLAAQAARPAADAAASTVIDPTLLTGLTWRSLGPARGGRSIAAAGTTARPDEYYFGATGGGLWKTTDGGVTWRPVGDGAFKTSSVGALAIAESNPDVVYVGMGEVALRGNIIQGDGVYKSSDGGASWVHLGLERSMAVARLRVHPTNPDVAYAAVLGDPYGPGDTRGVYKTSDGGKTWSRTLFRNDRTGAVDLSIDPDNPDVLYASLWEVFRTPHSLSSGGPGSGLFKSIDGGVTWTELSRHAGLPAPLWGKVGVSVSGADSNRVYAMIEAAEGGLFSSDDAGQTWTRVSDDRNLRQRAFYYTRLQADPQARDTVYVMNVAFHKSTDGGKTMTTIRVPHSDNHDLWIAPDDARRMINANDGGANVSTNGGQSWTGQQYPTAQFYNVITTAHVPYHVCGAQQDNSTACVPSTGGDLYEVGGGESGYIAPDPEDTDVFYAGSYGGLLTRINRRSGERRTVTIWPDNPMGFSAADITERFQWTFPIVIAPTDPDTIYATSQHVWKSTNEGHSWRRISPDLTRHDPSTLGPSGGPITLDQTGVETYATVFTLAPSPVNGRVIWAGSDDGLVHVTRDGGGSWQPVTPPDLPPFTRISLIDASPHDAGVAYLAGNRYQRADRSPYVYKTADYGRTWTKIVTGLPGDDFPRAVREDPKKRGLLYLGTETGFFVSVDDGGGWQPLRNGLPVTPVHGIRAHGDDLVIGTHGRGFYVMNNVGLLRQVTSATTTEPVVLFDPADAVRSISPGVTIDYYLKAAADAVTIEIRDRGDQVVATFSGSAAQDKTAATGGGGRGRGGAEAPAEGETGRGRGQAPPRVRTSAGVNRFTWDMRYPAARTFPGIILWAGSTRGPLAPPGRYQVRLTAGGETKTQEFQVDRNRAFTSVTDAHLEEQFALGRRINDAVSVANGAVIRIRQLKTQIADRLAKSTDPGAKAGGDTLTQALTGVEGEIYQYRNQSGQDPLNYPIRLNNKLAALQGVVESGDARPTEQAYQVFEELSGRLDAALGRLDAVLATELVAFNRTLAALKLEPVKDDAPR